MECARAKCGISVPVVEADGSSNQAFPGNWPWYAKITDKNGNYFCDGTLVSSNAVLTQANCFASESHFPSSHNLSVTLATVRFFQQENVEAKLFSVAEINSLSEMGGDVYMLRLSTSCNASRNIRPVCRADVQSSLNNVSSLQCVLLSLHFEADRLFSQKVHIVPVEKCQEQANSSAGAAIHSHWTSADAERRKVCVQLSEAEWSSGSGQCANFGNSGDCMTYLGNTGRHLFCQVKSIWHLFAVEVQTAVSVSKQSSSEEKRWHYRLFETLPRLSV